MKVRFEGGRHRGSIESVFAVSLCVIAMVVLMSACLTSIRIMDVKSQISQNARKYMLRMETTGYLTQDDKMELSAELARIGAVNLDFSGTTFERSDYGDKIYLMIKGQIKGEEVSVGGSLLNAVTKERYYDFAESRMSTAKN